LVVEYEKKYLMDQAMAGNAVYFKKFYQDLAAHRFVMIISEPLAYKFQGKGTVFGDENDAYVKWVTGPLLCYYEPTITYANEQLQFLVPRPVPLSDAHMCPASGSLLYPGACLADPWCGTFTTSTGPT